MAYCDSVVIFLDIDGVLLPVPRFSFGGGELSVESTRHLQRIVERCGGPEKVTIILSSTWRNFPEQVQRLNNFIATAVGDKIPPVAGGTPNGTPKVTAVTYYPEDPSERRLVRDRVDEIWRWIHTHMREHPEAVGGRWLAIDDMKLDVDERMRGHFIKTETDVGLTEEVVERAFDVIASFPSPETAAVSAAEALIDPVLKDEEIDILETKCRLLTDKVDELKEELRNANDEIRKLQAQRREYELEQKEAARRFEDVSYRLAQFEFAKKNETLQKALDVLATLTGKERRELEERIRSFVNLLRSKKALEKKKQKNKKKSERDLMSKEKEKCGD